MASLTILLRGVASSSFLLKHIHTLRAHSICVYSANFAVIIYVARGEMSMCVGKVDDNQHT